MDKNVIVYMVKNGVSDKTSRKLFEEGYEAAESFYGSKLDAGDIEEMFRTLMNVKPHSWCLGFKSYMLFVKGEYSETKENVRLFMISFGISTEPQIRSFYEGYEKAEKWINSGLCLGEVETLMSKTSSFMPQAWGYGIRAKIEEMEEKLNTN